MITFKAIQKSYRNCQGELVPILQGVDFSAREGEWVAIIGPSGCGKSTLLHIAGGLDSDYSGDVEIAGVNLAGLSDRALAEFRNQTIGFVFQSFHLLPTITALENVLLPSYFASNQKFPGVTRAQTLLEKVGLASKTQQRPRELSGGERQRVAIARALYCNPKVIFCDEPTGNLDSETGSQIISLFQKLAHQEGITLFMVTHEERISRLADRVMRLSQGKIVPETSFANLKPNNQPEA